MGYLLGIDLGTSSVRSMLVREDGRVSGIQGETYDISVPELLEAEQDPELWYQKTCLTIKKVLAETGAEPRDIKALSFSGQMHGLVCVGKNGEALCPAIIWPDQRTKDTISRIYDRAGRDCIVENTQNTISTGFLIASLMWLREERPKLFEKIDKVMLPKDYIKFRLTGEILTDFSDAAGSLAFDNIRLTWAWPLLDALGLPHQIFPECGSSTSTAGYVTARAGKESGLCPGTTVINGGSDQCMQGIGNGIIDQGIFASNIGTGGQISTVSNAPLFDRELRTNTFAHVLEKKWNIMGAALCSGNSLKWLMKKITGIADFDDLNSRCSKLPCGSEGLFFLPYLAGERTPHQNPDAKGVFAGMTLKHDRYDLARAVMEGVTYSLRDCMEIVLGTGLRCGKVIASGGGANSPLWLQMQADILEQPIHKSLTAEQACVGAAVTAGVGVGVYRDFNEACSLFVSLDTQVYEPLKENVKVYREGYEIFKELYLANVSVFEKISRLK